MIMIENTAFFCGELILSQIGEPVLTSFMMDYKLPLNELPSPFLGQDEVTDNFTFDWRNTQDPGIYQGAMSTWIVGELLYQDKSCKLDPDYFEFLDDIVFS
jgi:hypothetical protein